MKVAVNEIWDFSDLVHDENGSWRFHLVAGGCVVRNMTYEVLCQLKSDRHYDQEILPDLYTFREIMWQPDVAKKPNVLSGLRILNAYCEELIDHYQSDSELTCSIYGALLKGVAEQCKVALGAFSDKNASTIKILGSLRQTTFPVVSFFIHHPMNKADYRQDAVNRLNYAVKVLLTQFETKYSDLVQPYWEVMTGENQGLDQVRIEEKV